MRRAFLIGIVGIIILTGFMVSCDLFSDGTINFYRMVKGNDDVSEYRLRYRKDGWTIRMSLGQIEDTGFATKEQAEEKMGTVSFVLSVDGEEIVGGNKTAEQLGSNAWHVVVPYHVKLSKGTHAVIGTTNVGGVQLRTNTVNITVF